MRKLRRKYKWRYRSEVMACKNHWRDIMHAFLNENTLHVWEQEPILSRPEERRSHGPLAPVASALDGGAGYDQPRQSLEGE